jgi:hypothetical protein
MSTNSHLSTCVGTQSPKYLEMSQGHIFLSKAFGDSQLVVQQVLEEYQCFDGTLNSYLEKCWGIIYSLDEFSI